jgi:bifunctional non-homologous end joining protein LigD
MSLPAPEAALCYFHIGKKGWFMKKLTGYTEKRDFSRSPEPEPEKPGTGTVHPGAEGSFVIQEHHARRLHWDFRLEMDGVLKSWALPKGPPREKGERRLAVEVEDHPLEYMNFQGVIPEGNYGAGEVIIWDRGLYALLEKKPEKIKVVLKGKRLEGAFILIRKSKEENHWLIIKYQ